MKYPVHSSVFPVQWRHAAHC